MSDDLDLSIEDVLGESFNTDDEVFEEEEKSDEKPELRGEATEAVVLDDASFSDEKPAEVQKTENTVIGDVELVDVSMVPEDPYVKPEEEEKAPETEKPVQEKAPEQAAPKITKVDDSETAEALAGRLEMWNKSCRDLFMDLRMFTFNATEDEMFLICNDPRYFDRPLYFKSDPENPKDQKILWAQKQFCKLVGVPHAFFMNNRPSLRNEIVRTWQAGLDADESKAKCIARIRESEEYCVIRSFLPEEHNRLQNSELMRLVEECSRLVNQPFELEFSNGDNRDDLVLHARFLFSNEFDVCGSPCRIGFNITASELGKGQLVLDTLLHHVPSKTAYIAAYGAESFFSSKYEGIQASEIKEILPKMIDRLLDESEDMKLRIETELRDVDPHEECLRVSSWGGVPSKFKRSLFHEASAQEDDMDTTWNFARHISLIAKDFDAENRLKVERLSGRYLNLAFGKE